MKKNLLVGLLILSVTSCTKNLSNETAATETGALVSKKSAAANKKEYTQSVITEAYNGSYFDSCRQENIILVGTVTYGIQESFDDGYYISYDINLKATGTGERSGKAFHGGITQKAVTKENPEGNVRSRINYKLKFTSDDGEQISFIQTARFVFIAGKTKIDFNNISDSCK